MPLFNTACASAYLKLDKEDPEEVSHRKALFLIYKAMEQVDSVTRSPPPCLFLRMRFRKEKLRIGKKLKKLRKGISSMVFGARVSGHRKDIGTKTSAAWIRFFGREDKKISAIPPLLI